MTQNEVLIGQIGKLQKENDFLNNKLNHALKLVDAARNSRNDMRTRFYKHSERWFGLTIILCGITGVSCFFVGLAL